MAGAERWRERWTRFWFAPEPMDVLALVRIFFGIALLLELTGATGLYRLPGLQIGLPDQFHRSQYPLDGGFRLPVPGFAWLPAPSYDLYRVLELSLVPLCILFIAGLWTRWVGPLLALLYLYLFLLTQFAFHHHVLILVVGLLVLGFSRCAEHYSLDAHLAGPERPRPERMALPRRLLQTFVVLVYAFAVLQKLETDWLTGRVIAAFREAGTFNGPAAELLFAVVPPEAFGPLAVATEAFLAAGLCLPRVRRAALWVGVLFHAAIELTLPVGAYSYEMLALYIASLRPGAGRTVALYDGSRGSCRRSMRRARLLDWLRRVSWLDRRDPAAADVVRRVPADRRAADLIVITPEGRAHAGFAAWRALFGRFPLTFVAAPLLHALAGIGSPFFKRYLDDLRSFPGDARIAWRHGGWTALWPVLRSRTLGRVFRYGRLIVFEQELTVEPDRRLPAGVEIRVLGDEWAALAAMLGRRDIARFRARVAAGRTCLIAWRGAQPIGHVWVSSRIDAGIDGLLLALPANTDYIGDLYVLASERNCGVGAALVNAAHRHARARGRASVRFTVAPRNHASLRTVENTEREGFRIVGEVMYWKVLRRTYGRFRPERGAPAAPAVAAR